MKAGARPKKWIAGLMAVVLLAGGLLYGARQVWGFWDESRAVHIDASEVETSTLAIGTHLIHLSALTDSIYEIAAQSAEDSGQDQIYYKSELGGDAWFNITNATSLADITTGGVPVTDETIEALYFEYHTRSDRVTYDLWTGTAVNIFDIRDPYDLESLEELSPLKMQYDQLWETQRDSSKTRRLEDVWATPVESLAAVQEMDGALSSLQSYLDVLRDNGGGAEEMNAVSQVMEAVDAARRYEVFSALEPVLSDYLDELGEGEKTTIPGNGEDSEDIEIQSADTELMSAASESLSNVEAALITYGGKMLAEGTTVMSSVEYDISQSLISHAQQGDHAACDGDVNQLIQLGHVRDDIIADRPQELAMLDDTLLPAATQAYRQILSRGESAAYLAEVEKKSAQVVLDSLISENDGEANTCRSELEFLIEARCSRVDAESGMNFLDKRLQTANAMAAVIPQDAFADSCESSLNAHIDFLTQKQRELELGTGGNEMDSLTAQKADLQAQRLAALDKNDLAGAKALEDQISAVEEELRTMESEAASKIAAARAKVQSLQQQVEAAPDDGALKTQLSAAKAELAALESGLSDGSLGAMVAKLKSDALDGIADGSAEGKNTASNAVASLGDLLPVDPKLVLPAMQDIYNELLLNDGDQSLIDTIEQAILDNPNALRDELSLAQLNTIAQDYLAENGVTDGTGSTGNSGGTGSASGLLGTGGVSAADVKNAAIELAALQLYYDETGARAALQRIAALSQLQQQLGSGLLFKQLKDGDTEYLPLTAVQILTDWRYVWNKNANMGILARGSDYYGFTVYAAQVQRDRDGTATEEMAHSARYQSSVYIPEEYAYESFGVQTVYLSGTSLGCALDDSLLEKAQELLGRFLNGQ